MVAAVAKAAGGGADAVAARLGGFMCPLLADGTIAWEGGSLPLVLVIGPAGRGFWGWLNSLECPRLLSI